MISEEIAYESVKRKYEVSRLLCCLDFGTFYLFLFAPLFLNVHEGYLTGVTFDAVDKQTGKIFEYDISNDLDAFEKANEIKIKTFLDKKV